MIQTATLKDKRFLLSLLFIISIAVTFWTGSRVPALNEKAMMGGDIRLQDPLSFDAVIQINSEQPVLERIFYTTLNWIHTNEKGMAFGLLFGAAFMTFLSVLKRRSYKSGFANTFIGMLVGAPLGVCVNCAAPIALGMHSGGTRLETTLATMISSPTLNVIVLSMLLALFPMYMVVLKLGFTLLFIMVLLPLLSRLFFRKEIMANAVEPAPAFSDASGVVDLNGTIAGVEETLLDSLKWLVVSYTKNLWFIVKKALPLMLLAGFLGSVLITLIPWDVLLDYLPARTGQQMFFGWLVAALVGLFLPVPIAFDIIISAILLAAGMPVGYVMVFLFTLGIFSVYSYSVIAKAISWRVATVLSIVLVLMGVVVGAVTHVYEIWRTRDQQQFIFDAFANEKDFSDLSGNKAVLPKATAASDVLVMLRSAALEWRSPDITKMPADIEIEVLPMQRRASSDGSGLFVQIDGKDVGLQKIDTLPVAFKAVPPFNRSWSIATGDVHNDGWSDVILGTPAGLYLYSNIGGQRFVLQSVDVPQIQEWHIPNTALIDINNDGWLDIVFSVYKGGQYVLYNNHGVFSSEGLVKVNLPEPVANFAYAVSAGDVDQDGDLDIFVGNWSTGEFTNIPPLASRNLMLLNESGELEAKQMEGMIGETISALLTDFNMDGDLDLLVGNDFEQPDIVYVGKPGSEFEVLDKQSSPFPYTTDTTMSIDTADINNDLNLDVFSSQITGRSPADQRLLQVRVIGNYCNELESARLRSQCEERVQAIRTITSSGKTRDAYECLEIADKESRLDCIAIRLLSSSTEFNRKRKSILTRFVKPVEDKNMCNKFPERWKDFAYICNYVYLPAVYRRGDPQYNTAVPQMKDYNTLYISDGNGGYKEVAREMGLHVTGWTWNSKIADFNNDEWQDIFAVNGWFGAKMRESNVYFENMQGKLFADKTKEYNLTDFMTTETYGMLDMDNDGDLDIITLSSEAPLKVYRNQTRNPAIIFELADRKGNYFGVGSKLIIHYGKNDERHQLREIKSGGGHLAHEAPLAHFGLGKYDRVNRVEILWSTGERTELSGRFEAGNRYRIIRKASALAAMDTGSAKP